MKTVIGVFDNFAQAQNAIHSLEAMGFSDRDVSVVTNNTSGNYGGSTTERRPNVGSETAAGALAGGLTGLLIGLAPLVIPGLGAIAAAGWLTMTLTGAAIGAGVGLIGALMGIGVPEEEAHFYQENIRRGGTLVVVRADDNRADDVARILSDAGAIDIDERAAQYRNEGYTPAMGAAATATPMAAGTIATTATPATNYAVDQNRITDVTMPRTDTAAVRAMNETDREVAIPVVEEELQVGKRQIQRGGVRVFTHAMETPVTETVNLREEHVRVDRHPVNRPVSEADMNALRNETIEITERAEVPVVHKEARVVEEVVINKEATERVETVSDTVRRTDVEVEELGGASTVSNLDRDVNANRDTRGVGEKIADAVTGDRVDDKTGRVVR